MAVDHGPAQTTEALKKLAAESPDREELWTNFIQWAEVETMAEVGVFRGAFAAKILSTCPSLKTYYMVDPWRHLEGWNKPANKEDRLFEKYLAETKAVTEFAAAKRVILRGKTTEIIDDLPSEGLDFAYIDGDHTLKGITIDLTLVYPKVRDGGFIGGDDFSRTIWQHDRRFEPTLVFPFAIYFAEAVGARIYALPHSQFLIEKAAGRSFEFVDLTGLYDDLSLSQQFVDRKAPEPAVPEASSWLKQMMRKVLREP